MKTSFRIMQERGFEGGEKGGKKAEALLFSPRF